MKLVLLTLAAFFAGWAGGRVHTREKWIAQAMRDTGVDRQGAERYWIKSIAAFLVLACLLLLAYFMGD